LFEQLLLFVRKWRTIYRLYQFRPESIYMVSLYRDRHV